jgi:polar amino acid transport system permease protein
MTGTPYLLSFLDLISSHLAFMIEGLPVTLSLTAYGMGLGFLLGLPLAILRVYCGKAGKLLVASYERIMRSVPALVLIFVFYFGVHTSVIEIPGFLAVALALGLCSSGYQSQVFRGALESVGSGQMDAARSLGMGRLQAIRFVIVPQALRFALPSWANELATMVKDTSLAFVVGVAELMRRADYVRAATYDPLIPFLLVAGIYFAIVFPITRIAGTWGQEKKRLMVGG